MKRRRARAVLVAGLLAVAGMHLFVNVLLDTAKPEWRDPEYAWRERYLRAAGPCAVALGSSRTQMALDPARTGAKLFNLGQAGAGPLQMRLNLERLFAAGIVPDAVLVEIMPATLGQAGYAEQFFHDQMAKLSAHDMAFLERYAADSFAWRRQWLAVRTNPAYEQRFPIVSHLAPWLLPWQQRVDFQWKTMSDRGWLPYPFETIPPAERDRGRAVARANYLGTLDEFRAAPLPERALRELVACCRCRGIRVAFYLLPEAESFRTMYGPGTHCAMRKYLASFDVPLFDASAWVPAEDDYADGHHMMRHAAEAFSERFGAECVRPWLRD